MLEKDGNITANERECAAILNAQYSSVFVPDDGNLIDITLQTDEVLSELLISRASITNCINKLTKDIFSEGPEFPLYFFKKAKKNRYAFHYQLCF